MKSQLTVEERDQLRRHLIDHWCEIYTEAKEAFRLAQQYEDLQVTHEEFEKEIATLQDALWEIRDWFDSVLIRKEPMRDPRKMLALVERELGL